MDDLKHLLVDVEKGLAALQQLQHEYDAELWAINSPPFAKYRHIVIHLSILAGELSKLSEALEHQTTTRDMSELDIQSHVDKIAPWIADLLIHAGQLANISNQEMYPVFLNRIKANALKFRSNSRFTQIAVFPPSGADEENSELMLDRPASTP